MDAGMEEILKNIGMTYEELLAWRDRTRLEFLKEKLKARQSARARGEWALKFYPLY